MQLRSLSDQETPDITLDPTDYPTEVNKLIRQQNAIGWKQLWLGRFSEEWSDIQDNFYARKQNGKKEKKIR
jgi:hypothetical protein